MCRSHRRPAERQLSRAADTSPRWRRPGSERSGDKGHRAVGELPKGSGRGAGLRSRRGGARRPRAGHSLLRERRARAW
eukprot:3558099-Rhodomonas_salina.3